MNRKYRRKYLFEFAKEKTNYKNKFYNQTVDKDLGIPPRIFL